MSFINNLLRGQTDGGAAGYGLTGTVATALMIAAVLFYLLRMRLDLRTWLKGLAVGAVTYYFSIYAHWLMQWYAVGFDPGRYTAQAANLALAFTLLPLPAWLCAKVFNLPVGFTGDVAALTMLGFHVIGRSGCLFTGCCYGFPCDWGWYSHETGANQFPTPLVESLFTLGILIFILLRIGRKGYVPDGKNLPWFLLLYGVCRFFSELTRQSTADRWLFWRVSDIHLHMLAMALVGGWMLYAILAQEKAAAGPVLGGRRK